MHIVSRFLPHSRDFLAIVPVRTSTKLLPWLVTQKHVRSQAVQFGTSLQKNRELFGVMTNTAEKNTHFTRSEASAKLEIRDAATCKDWLRAYRLFRSIDEPGSSEYAAVLHAADRCNRLLEAEQIFAEMLNKRIKGDIHVFTSLVNLSCRHGQLMRAETLIQDLKAIGIQPDVMLYSAILNGHAQIGDIGAANQVWQEMLDCSLRPTSISFVSLLNVCAAAAQPELATNHLADMDSYNLTPQITHWNVVLKACQRKPDASAAMSILTKMRKSSVLPNIVSYTSVLYALVREQRADWQVEADALLADMTKSGVDPDVHFFEVRAVARLGATTTEEAISRITECDRQQLEGATGELREAQTRGLVLSPRFERLVRIVESRMLEILLEPLGQQYAMAPPRRSLCSHDRMFFSPTGTYEPGTNLVG